MWFLHLHDVLRHLSQMNPHVAEAVIIGAAAVLVGCAASCASSPCREHDAIFRKHIA